MPSGKTHDRITLWTLPWIVGISQLVTSNSTLTLIVASAYLFSGLMFGPDLDIYSIQYKRWGKLRFIWLPYQKIMTHRSFLSHGFLIGTIIRILYLLTWLTFLGLIIILIIYLINQFSWPWQQSIRNLLILMINHYGLEIIALIIGLELGSMSHSLSDWIGSTYKKAHKPKLSPKTSKSHRKKP